MASAIILGPQLPFQHGTAATATAAHSRKPGVTLGLTVAIWHVYYSPLGEPYYHNHSTGDTTWKRPSAAGCTIIDTGRTYKPKPQQARSQTRSRTWTKAASRAPQLSDKKKHKRRSKKVVLTTTASSQRGRAVKAAWPSRASTAMSAMSAAEGPATAAATTLPAINAFPAKTAKRAAALSSTGSKSSSTSRRSSVEAAAAVSHSARRHSDSPALLSIKAAPTAHRKKKKAVPSSSASPSGSAAASSSRAVTPRQQRITGRHAAQSPRAGTASPRRQHPPRHSTAKKKSKVASPEKEEKKSTKKGMKEARPITAPAPRSPSRARSRPSTTATEAASPSRSKAAAAAPSTPKRVTRLRTAAGHQRSVSAPRPATHASLSLASPRSGLCIQPSSNTTRASTPPPTRQDARNKTFFIMGYPDLKAALVSRGWRQITDPSTARFGIKWIPKSGKIVHRHLRPHQFVNHFEDSKAVCTKYRLSNNLRNHLPTVDANVTAHRFFPRCYDLNEPEQWSAFLLDYQITAAQGILRAVAHKLLEASGCSTAAAPSLAGAAETKAEEGDTKAHDAAAPNLLHPSLIKALPKVLVNLAVLRAAICVANKGTVPAGNTADKDAVVGALDWQFIRYCSVFAAGTPQEQRSTTKSTSVMMETLVPDAKLFVFPSHELTAAQHANASALSPIGESEWRRIVRLLASLDAVQQRQSSLLADQPRNVWIIKPASQSRGRGIECHSDVADIMKLVGTTNNTMHWVVQKYIERPLIINTRKFDIRQWILVTGWDPLVVYVFDHFYLRFCCVNFTLDNLSDKYIHLSNNSVQHHAKEFKVEESMWSSQQLRQHMELETGSHDMYDNHLRPAMLEVIVWTLSGARTEVKHRHNTCEIYGLDFMIDADYRPWLIEVNSSPDFSYSTSITKALVQQAAADIAKVIVDVPDYRRSHMEATAGLIEPLADAAASKHVDTGGWKLIHAGKPFPKPARGRKK